MEWVGVAVAVIAGIGSGFLSAVASPFAIRRAEEAKLQTEAKRKIISEGRAMLAEALARSTTHRWIAGDVRFMALKRHLPDEIQAEYDEMRRKKIIYAGGGPYHAKLQAAIDDLEKNWNLV